MADRVAITGSFCPPHIGHSYLEVTALEAGYEPVIIIGNNPDKIYDPNLKNNRIRLCKELFRSNVYSSDTTNLGDFAKRKGCLKILRGYRNDKDYEYELDLAEWNRVNNGLSHCPRCMATCGCTQVPCNKESPPLTDCTNSDMGIPISAPKASRYSLVPFNLW